MSLQPVNATTNEEARVNWIQWAQTLYENEKELYEKLEAYYIGEHTLEFATDRWEDVFSDTFEEFADNWCGVVVDALAQRLEITGWQVDKKDKALTDAAEEIWDRNALEVEEEDLYTGTISKGDGYLMVWSGEAIDGQDIPKGAAEAEIFYHDALDVNVAYDPANRRDVIRASKKWIDELGQQHLRIYHKDRIEQFIVPAQSNIAFFLEFGFDRDVLPENWQREGPDIVNPYGIVPVFHFRNRRRNSTHGLSEIKSVIPVQNAVNKLFMDMMVGSEFGSFRQKWMAGGGHPKEGWKSGVTRMWATTDPNAKFGEFGQTDLEQLVRAIEMVVMHIAKITQTPMHYLRTSGDMPSGEALKTAESGLIKKAVNRQKVFGRSWAQAMTFAVQIELGMTEKPEQLIYPVWESPETRHDLEQAQTAQLKSLLGVPLETLWSEHFGYTQEQIDDFKKQNKALAASVLADVLAQTGQKPPGTESATGMLPAGFDSTQLLALLGKGVTSQSSAGEATPSPQPNTGPPASPTRRGTGFKD